MIQRISKNKIFESSGKTMAWCWILLSAILISCSNNHKRYAPAIKMRDSLSVLSTYNVNTLISDSGIIRFRLKAKEWLIYDKRRPSFWAFEKGFYVEQFDSALNINANIKADTAYFYDQERLWKLKGHVAIKNRKGEKFNTEELFWNQATQKVYSDKFIRIEQIERIITGHGFESNQEMTVWKIKNISGIFYVNPHPADTTKAEPVK
jgi:LPS export ABC transporter protein LptC